EEEAEQHGREVEQLRRQPDEVHRRGGREEERDGERDRRRVARARADERIAGAEARGQEQRVQYEEAIGAEQDDERRRRQRVDEGLAVVETVAAVVGRRRHPHERERRLALEPDLTALLQEDALRA